MSKFANQEVLRVRGLSMKAIARKGELFLRGFDHNALETPTVLLGDELRKHIEFDYEFGVIPVSKSEMGPHEALTTLEKPVQIWMREDYELKLRDQSPYGYRSKVTLLHEFFHAFEHAPQVQRMPEMALYRPQRGKIQAYEDSEWQAFAFAGSVLMPHRAILTLPPEKRTPHDIGLHFGVSEGMANSHLRRLRNAKLI